MTGIFKKSDKELFSQKSGRYVIEDGILLPFNLISDEATFSSLSNFFSLRSMLLTSFFDFFFKVFSHSLF